MKVHLLVEREAQSSNAYWVVDATDEYAVDEWGGRYPDAFQIRLDEPKHDRRILIVELPEGALELPWRESIVKGAVVDGT